MLRSEGQCILLAIQPKAYVLTSHYLMLCRGHGQCTGLGWDEGGGGGHGQCTGLGWDEGGHGQCTGLGWDEGGMGSVLG